MHARSHSVFALAALVSLSVSALALQKFIPHPALRLAVSIAIIAAITFLPTIRQHPLARSRWLLIGLISIFFVEALAIYPVVDARKTFGGGSDQDDAIIQAADQLRAGHFPYADRTYLGNPITPGPGWVMLNTPAVEVHAYPLQAPILIAIAAWLLWTIAPTAAVLFAAILALTPGLHLLIINGSDLPTLSAALLILCLTVYSRPLFGRVAWVILFGMVATARLNLIVLPIAVLALRRDWKTSRAWLETFSTLVIAATLHWLFYRVSPTQYTPLHILTKAHTYLTGVTPVLILCAIACIYLLLRYKAETSAQMAALLGLFLLLSHLPAAIGSLRYVHGDLAHWEGYEYLSVSILCLAGGVALIASPTVRQTT
jgi:hypothetical protein